MFNKRCLFVYLPLVVSLAGCSGSDTPMQECKTGQVMIGMKNGKPECAVAPAISPCPTGQVMTGTNADGTAICSTETISMGCPSDFPLASNNGTAAVCYKAILLNDATGAILRTDTTFTDVTWDAAYSECWKSGAHLCSVSEFRGACEILGGNNIIAGMWLGDPVWDNVYLFTNGITCRDFEGAACKCGYTNDSTYPPVCTAGGGLASCPPAPTNHFIGGYCCIDPQPKIQ